MSKIVGIDLGTTNSVVSILEGGEAKVIPNKEGGRTTPSVVAFLDNGQRLVGGPARRQAVTNPTRTIFSIKRFMGRRHEEVSSEEKMVPYTVVGGPKDLVKVQIGDKQYAPAEISAQVLAYLKECAEDYLGEKVSKAVITVPAYFNDSQRQATKDAGKIAGFEVERIINEPTAAAIAYGMDKKKTGKIAVFDLGGGTFDISILDIGDGVFEVLATNGDTHLGGDDFDSALIGWVAGEFKKEQGIDLRQDNMALQRLKEACEKAKCELSSAQETQINLPFITADASGPKHLMLSLTRAKFESLCADLFDRCKRPCEQALKDAGLQASEIAEVILVGGSIRIPRVQALVKEIFGKDGNKSVNPDEVVAQGAAVQGGVLSGHVEDLVLLDVTPLSLGIETLGGVMTVLIPRNTTIPTTKKETFSTAADGQTSVEVHVLQGERTLARDNRSLDRFHLDGIPAAPRGMPQIEVEFDLDANGILHVRARDQAAKKEHKVRIEQSSGLSDQDVKRMQREADEFKEQDAQSRGRVEKRNVADQAVWQAQKTLREHADKIDEADKKAVEERIAALELAIKEDRADDFERLSLELQQSLQPVAEKIYQKAGTGGGSSAGGSQAGGGTAGGEPAAAGEAQEGEVVDADFEVKK